MNNAVATADTAASPTAVGTSLGASLVMSADACRNTGVAHAAASVAIAFSCSVSLASVA